MHISNDELENSQNLTSNEWEKWIYETSYGFNNKDISLPVNDVFPHQIIRDKYINIHIQEFNEEIELRFLSGLYQSFCKTNIEFIKLNPEKLAYDIDALENHLQVISYIFRNSGSMAVAARRLSYTQTCFEVYNYIFRKNSDLEPIKTNFNLNSLMRVVLETCFQLNEKSIPTTDLSNALDSNELNVIAFRCLMKKYGINSVGKYFYRFCISCYKSEKKFLFVRELDKIISDFSKSGKGIDLLSEELNKTLTMLEQNSEIYNTELIQIISSKVELFLSDVKINKLIDSIFQDGEMRKRLIDLYYENSIQDFPLLIELFVLQLKTYPKDFGRIVNAFLSHKIAHVPLEKSNYSVYLINRIVKYISIESIVSEFNEISKENLKLFVRLFLTPRWSPLEYIYSKSNLSVEIALKSGSNYHPRFHIITYRSNNQYFFNLCEQLKSEYIQSFSEPNDYFEEAFKLILNS
jgi:hypothetical protein